MQITTLKQGRQFFQADVLLVETESGRAVWKDYRKFGGTPLAPLGRWLVQREAGIVGRLPRGCAPQVMIHPDPLVLSMEYIDGRTPLPGDIGIWASLEEMLLILEQTGIVHNDLHRSNVMILNNRLILIDFTGAILFPRYLRWAGFRWLHQRDTVHAKKIAKRCGCSVEVAPNPAWLRAMQGAWRFVYRRREVREISETPDGRI